MRGRGAGGLVLAPKGLKGSVQFYFILPLVSTPTLFLYLLNTS